VRTLATWLATLAIALHAFWPLIAHAKPKAAGPLVPVCTVDGITHYLELPPVDSPAERQYKAHHDHCSFCFAGLQPSIASAPFDAVLAVEDGTVSSGWAETSSFKNRHYSSSLSRAPPIS
jgi:hypothetical protein